MTAFSSELDWSLVAGTFGSSAIFVHLWTVDSTWLSQRAVMNTAGLTWHWENAENPLWYTWELYCSGSFQNCQMLVRHFKIPVMLGRAGGRGTELGGCWALGLCWILWQYFPNFKLLLVCDVMVKHAAGPCIMYKRHSVNMLRVNDGLRNHGRWSCSDAKELH